MLQPRLRLKQCPACVIGPESIKTKVQQIRIERAPNHAAARMAQQELISFLHS